MEREDYGQTRAEYKQKFPKYGWTIDLLVIPVNLASEHKKMLHAKMIFDVTDGLIAINSKFNKLITSLWTAVEKGEGTLD